MSADVQEAVGAILRAAAALSREQDLLDQDAERAPAARDYAVRKLVEAFKRFEVGAQAATKPLTIKIILSPQSGAR